MSYPSPPARGDLPFFEEVFDGNVLTASLDNEKKVIFTRQYHRPPAGGHVPAFEIFHSDDIAE